ncbi:Hypothetical protein PSEBR_m1602 [Pseudomonas brassicacearum subsp. brassicacearum NFM421]|uniref:Uncharacterized protein n=1 Tax=Pseudomonas brassicacearum (strain NFM421) TaxID=994484 RepID=F2KM50_PSEBN|nr:Hypothetical protein PSEBR_m1602 [Pseudomonas brassicacearum subsp. brassicacearum NFM421]
MADERSAITNYVFHLYLRDSELSLASGHPKQGRAGTPARGSSGVSFQEPVFLKAFWGVKRQLGSQRLSSID